MKFATSRFGEVEVEDDRIIFFPGRLPGFRSHHFAILHDEAKPVVEWLQSTEEPEIAVMMIDPMLLVADYAPAPPVDELNEITDGPPEEAELIMRVIIRKADEHPGHLYANLFAPIFIDAATCRGMQLPLVQSSYSVRTLWPPLAAADERSGESDQASAPADENTP